MGPPMKIVIFLVAVAVGLVGCNPVPQLSTSSELLNGLIASEMENGNCGMMAELMKMGPNSVSPELLSEMLGALMAKGSCSDTKKCGLLADILGSLINLNGTGGLVGNILGLLGRCGNSTDCGALTKLLETIIGPGGGIDSGLLPQVVEILVGSCKNNTDTCGALQRIILVLLGNETSVVNDLLYALIGSCGGDPNGNYTRCGLLQKVIKLLLQAGDRGLVQKLLNELIGSCNDKESCGFLLELLRLLGDDPNNLVGDVLRLALGSCQNNNNNNQTDCSVLGRLISVLLQAGTPGDLTILLERLLGSCDQPNEVCGLLPRLVEILVGTGGGAIPDILIELIGRCENYTGPCGCNGTSGGGSGTNCSLIQELILGVLGNGQPSEGTLRGLLSLLLGSCGSGTPGNCGTGNNTYCSLLQSIIQLLIGNGRPSSEILPLIDALLDLLVGRCSGANPCNGGNSTYCLFLQNATMTLLGNGQPSSDYDQLILKLVNLLAKNCSGGYPGTPGGGGNNPNCGLLGQILTLLFGNDPSNGLLPGILFDLLGGCGTGTPGGGGGSTSQCGLLQKILEALFGNGEVSNSLLQNILNALLGSCSSGDPNYPGGGGNNTDCKLIQDLIYAVVRTKEPSLSLLSRLLQILTKYCDGGNGGGCKPGNPNDICALLEKVIALLLQRGEICESDLRAYLFYFLNRCGGKQVDPNCCVDTCTLLQWALAVLLECGETVDRCLLNNLLQAIIMECGEKCNSLIPQVQPLMNGLNVPNSAIQYPLMPTNAIPMYRRTL